MQKNGYAATNPIPGGVNTCSTNGISWPLTVFNGKKNTSQPRINLLRAGAKAFDRMRLRSDIGSRGNAGGLGRHSANAARAGKLTVNGNSRTLSGTGIIEKARREWVLQLEGQTDTNLIQEREKHRAVPGSRKNIHKVDPTAKRKIWEDQSKPRTALRVTVTPTDQKNLTAKRRGNQGVSTETQLTSLITEIGREKNSGQQ